MKYKIQSACDKQALLHLIAGKYDWVLWSGEEKDQCVQIGGLFRNTYADRKHSNCVDYDNRYFRSEQLTFQSRKAAVRWVRKHKDFIVEDYKKRNNRRIPHSVMVAQWHGSGVFYMSI